MMDDRDISKDADRAANPIDYESAVRDLLRRRRRRKLVGLLARLPDPRPASPGQVVLAGLLFLILGWLIPPIHPAMLVGAVLLVLGFASGFIQPRGKTITWRNRTREVPPERRRTDRLYRVFYRS
ncbi:MAG: hypothetical protein ACRDIY_14685 [Chloroflexota bacterium]